MTRKTNPKFIALKNLLTILLAILMCSCLFLASACNKADSSTKIPEYSYVDSSDSTIKNTSFASDTLNMEYKNFPKVSVDGWNLAKDSSAKSGAIDVSEKGWNELMLNLVNDAGLLNYVKSLNGNFTDSDIRDMIRKEANDTSLSPTSAEVKKYIAENYFIYPEQPDPDKTYAFINPSTHAQDIDSKIYMLNSYKTGDLGFGGVQSLTSSTDLTLKSGEYARISAWVKTDNLNTANTSIGYGKEIGANIRVKNTFNNNPQADFGIFNITDTEWKEYHFYVKGDQVYETKFTLVLGLGYGDYAAEGTAYFDDINVEILDKDEYASYIAKETVEPKVYNIDYNVKENENLLVQASNYNDNYHLYSMAVDLTQQQSLTKNVVFSNDTTDNIYYKFTEYQGNIVNGNPTGSLIASDIVDSVNNFSDVPYGISEGIKATINKPASFTIKLDDNGSEFTLDSEHYMSFTFFVKNQLSKLYATSIVINVQDIYNNTTTERPAVATISDVSDEWVKYTVNIYNNFDKDNAEYKTRKFYLDIVIGPDAYQDDIDNYALGTVSITNPIVATGATYQYVDENKEIETPNYNFYKLFSNTSVGSTALYAGYSEDYTADETDGSIYNFTVAPNDIATIIDRPANPKGYKGIEANHYYITGNTEDSIEVNTNTNSGLINSKYVDNYGDEIKNALNYSGENAIQPLMIKTNGKSYGFIGENNYIEASSYAQISVKVRAYNASAFIYLVDVSKTEKKVMTFDSFTVNTTDGEFNNNGQFIPEKDLYFEISSDDMGGKDWITVDFYIATGATAKEFRVELWNGSRSNTNQLANDGYVFFDEVVVTVSGAFVEPARWEDALSGTDSPLSGKVGAFTSSKLLTYKRELSAIEKQYNNDKNKTGANISYPSTYVYAETNTMIYAIYNSIDPVAYDPYDNEQGDDAEVEETTTQTDPSAFWLSFSTILLGVALIIAIIMLFIKNIRRRRRSNVNDAKSHYTVKSRVNTQKKTKLDKVAVDTNSDEEIVEEDSEEIIEEEEEIVEEETNDTQEQTLDEYVYGDVQDFGNDDNNSEEKKDNE